MILFSLLFVFVVGAMLSDGENPLEYAGVWIFGVILGIYWLARWRRRRQIADSPSVVASSAATPAGAEPDLDMFIGLRGWSEHECPAEVATATCSLSWRDPAYLRALLVVATLRGDDAGRTVAGAARRLLRPASGA